MQKLDYHIMTGLDVCPSFLSAVQKAVVQFAKPCQETEKRTENLVRQLLKCPDFKSLWEEVEQIFHGHKITVIPKDKDSRKVAFKASFRFRDITYLHKEETEYCFLCTPKIYYLRSLSDVEAKKLILFELCNLYCAKQYADLDQQCIRGRLTKNEYIKRKYQIELGQVPDIRNKILDVLVKKGVVSDKKLYPSTYDEVRKHRQKLDEEYDSLILEG